ncbi:hypothetical protein H8356DRAFT_1356688 [Neocallimastix lanati (nom. inval.)]|nr:hypothetical protein H8356DRAFT_1356688 [Neocallimastix sp. JGI-2020a]
MPHRENIRLRNTVDSAMLNQAPGSTPPFDHLLVFPEQKGFRLQTRYCPNSGPERVVLVTVINILTREFLAYERSETTNNQSTGVLARDSMGQGIRHLKSIPRKIVLENLSNNMYGTISTKRCDYLNIPMS